MVLQFFKKDLKRYHLLISLFLLMGLLYGGNHLIFQWNNHGPKAQLINYGTPYPANYTINNMVVDGVLNFGSTEWDSDYMDLSDAFYDGAIYFQWNYTYLFVGFWIEDLTEDEGDFFVFYLDVDDDNVLTNYRDCAVIILPNDDIAFGVWDGSNYAPSIIPTGLIGNCEYNFESSRYEYEIRFPMGNLSNPYSGEIGFSYRAYDDSLSGELTDPNLMNIDQWNQIVFNWVTPDLQVSVDNNGGFNDSTRFKFTGTYQSAINRPPLSVILNITSKSNPLLSEEFLMNAENPADNNMIDGKTYSYSLCFENFTEGEYEYFIKCNDGKQISQSAKKSDVYVIKNTESLILFDGMHYSYRYTGIFGSTAVFNDTYSYDSGVFWNINSEDTYLGASTALRVLDSSNRGFDVLSGTYHFTDLTHEYAFIPINTKIGDNYFISVIGDGDVNFTCVQTKAEISALGGQIFYAYRLTNGSSVLYYDMQTGMLLYGNFIVTGMGTLNDYELTLQTNNIYANLWKPVIKNIGITPIESNINSSVLFNVTYVDWDGNTNEIVSISFINGTDTYGPFTMTFSPSLGTNRKIGVSYIYSCVFWNTSYLEMWKNYTTLVTAVDGRHLGTGMAIGPNITYINTKQPTLSDWDYTPSSPVGNETSIQFTVSYTDMDNNYPRFLVLNLPSGSYLMTQANPNDRNYTDGAVYSYIISNIPYLGTHNYNFTIIDQEGGALIEIGGGTITIYDQPPDIYINSPINTWQIGESVLIDLSSTSTDVHTIFYNVTNLATMTNQTFIYSGPTSQIFPAGNYRLFAWVNDTTSNYNMTSKLFTTTQDPNFKIMLVDMDNSTLDAYYISALESIGFKTGQHFTVWKYFPTLSDLSGYDIMILITGSSYYDFSVNDSVLCNFVENGGAVLIAGQEYLRYGLTTFAQDYMGIYDATPSTGTSLYGITANLISGNGYPNVLQYTLGNIIAENYTQQRVWSLYYDVDPMFEINGNTVAIMNSTGNGRIAFLTFEFARISQENQRTELMKRMVYWLAESAYVSLDSPSAPYYYSTDVHLTLSSTDVSLDSIWFNLYDITNDQWLNVNEGVTLGDQILNLDDETDYRIFIYTNNCWGYYAQPIIFEFRCDNTPPTFSILSPTNTTYIDFRIKYLNFTFYSSSEDFNFISINIWNYSSSSYIYTWGEMTYYNFGTWLIPDYDEGHYRFEAFAVDYASNPTELFNVNFTVNNMPNVTIILPNVARISNNSVVQVNITAWDKDGVHTILFDIMNTSNSQYIYQNVIYDNNNPATWYLVLPDGTYRIFGKANDSFGNMALPIRNFTFTVDTTGPTINTYLDIANSGEIWIGRNNLYILFSSSDTYLSKMWYRIYNSTGETWLTPNNVSYSGSIVNIQNLVEAEYVVVLWANDSLNNVMQIYRYVKIDLTAPTYVSIDLDSNEINTPIEVTVVGADFTSVSSCTMYYQVSGVNGTTQITMTKTDTWTFQAMLPGWNYGTNITYWFTLRDSLQHTITSINYSLLINGLASGGNYVFDYRALYNSEVLFNITSGGILFINVSEINPIGVSIPNIHAVLSYIDIEFDGVVDNAEIRIYYSFGIDFSEIKLMHYVNGKWVKMDLIESEDGTYAYATISSFSTYALVQIEQTFLDILMNPIILSIILALLVATIVAFALYSRTKKKYKEEMGGVQTRKLGKLDKQDMNKYETPAASTDFPEKNIYDSIKEKKQKAKTDMKGEKSKKQQPTTYIKKSTEETEETEETGESEVSEEIMEKTEVPRPSIKATKPVIPIPKDIKELDYYCENCKKTVRLGFLAEQPSQPCPDCGAKMGVKVVCKKCNASFQVSADQYEALIKQKTPCPKCKTPLI